MIIKAASKAALDEIVSELVAAKATHSGGRLRNHLSIAHRSLVDSGVHITKDALKKRVSRAILARKSAEEIIEVEAVNSPSSAVSSADPTANTDENISAIDEGNNEELPDQRTPKNPDDIDEDDVQPDPDPATQTKSKAAGRPKGTTQSKKRKDANVSSFCNLWHRGSPSIVIAAR